MQLCNLLGWIDIRKFFCSAEQLKGFCAEILFVGRVYYMDTGILSANDRPMIIQQLLPAVGPALLIAIGYVDPGKWAAVVEGGAHFGSDLVLLMLVFSFAAILCQYLSASIAVVTGRDLSQVVRRYFLDLIYHEDHQYLVILASLILNSFSCSLYSCICLLGME